MKKEKNLIEEFKNLIDPPSLAPLAAATQVAHDIIQSPDYDEASKQECFRLLVETFCFRVRNSCIVDTFYSFARAFQVHIGTSDEHSTLMEFARKVLNSPQVVEALSSASVKNSHSYFVSQSAKLIEKFFSEESILKILRKRTKKLVSFIFGHHPAILRDVELQKKWIKSYLSYPHIEPAFGIRYITDEALNSLPLEISFAFIKKIISFLTPNLMKHFSLETIKNIALVHVTVYGKDEDNQYVLKHLEEYRTIFCNVQ